MAPPTDTVDVDGADAVPTAPPVARGCNGRPSIDAMRPRGLTQDLTFGNEPEPSRAPPFPMTVLFIVAPQSARPGPSRGVLVFRSIDDCGEDDQTDKDSDP